jgi:hypothetical protein
MRNRFLIVPLLLFTLGLAGCAGITNPVSGTNIYQAKTLYAGTLELVVKWRELCWSKPYAALMADPIARPVCENRRSRLRTIQSADDKAFAAITVAENFVTANPTLNAGTAVSAAWNAATAFSKAVPAVSSAK